MSAAYLGAKTLAGCFPVAVEAQGAVAASVAIGLPEVSGKLLGALNVELALVVGPPQLTATIQAAIQTVLSLQAAIGGPTVTLQAAAITALIAELQATLGTLQGYAAFGLSLGALLGTAGVYAYSYTGAVGGLGAALQDVLGSGPPGTSSGDLAGAAIFVATVPAARAALGTFVGVSL